MKRVNYLTLLFWISLFVVLISKNTFASSSNRIYNDSLFETSDSIKVINDSITKINFENLKILQSDYLESGNSRYTLAGYLPYKHTQLKPATVIGFGSALLALATTITLYQQAWYPDSTSGKFNFESLDYGWKYSLQLDKLGHTFGGFISTYFSNEAFTACGMNPDDAAFYGVIGGLFFQTFIEIQDGFHSNYGFDWTDELSNVLGASYFYIQRKIPALQNYRLKWSAGPSYRDSSRNAAQIRSRLLVDDYDGQNVWLSFKMHNILPNNIKDYWPKWLCLALGYGVKDVELIGYSPYRTAYVSLDYDLIELLPNLGTFGNWLVQTLNNFRLPAPALQLLPELKFIILFPFKISF